MDRREFLKTGAAAAAAAACPSAASGYPANDRFVVGVVGTGGMGTVHTIHLARRKDVRVAWVCDVDERHSGRAAGEVKNVTGEAPKVVKDLRQVLDDKEVQAVFIGAPDHWHAPAAILACDAGKHVYVEKPGSHNIREGRLMIEAARRNNRVLQVGTQSRSTAHVRKAMELLRQGVIGDVLVAKAWNSQRRSNIGKVKPSNPPANLDYDLWVGPAPLVPFKVNMHPAHWRWFYNFGAGDMGNDGVHDIDLAVWGLGADTHPSTIAALGGKYFFDDDQEFPDTQYVIFEYPPDAKSPRKRQLIYEHRTWSPYVQEGHENGNAFYGTKGLMILSKHGGFQVFGERNKPGETGKGSPDLDAHHQNFFDCAREGKLPHADAEVHHLSSTLVHLGNIATRLGRTLRFDPKAETFPGDEEAARLVRRTYREGHWAVPKGA